MEKCEICWIKKDTLIPEREQYEGPLLLAEIVCLLLDRPNVRAVIVPRNAQDMEKVRILTEEGWHFDDIDNNMLITKPEITTLERKEIKNFMQRENLCKSLKVSENMGGSYSALEPPQKRKVLSRISTIIDMLVEQGYFKKVDKSSLVKRLATLVEKYPEITSLTDDELAQRIEKIMVIDVLDGMLQDLTPEDLNSFNEAVKKRFFR